MSTEFLTTHAPHALRAAPRSLALVVAELSKH
jgi:hypothetical protein